MGYSKKLFKDLTDADTEQNRYNQEQNYLNEEPTEWLVGKYTDEWQETIQNTQ